MSDDIVPFVIACRACWWQERWYSFLWRERLMHECCPRCAGRLVVLNWYADDASHATAVTAKQPPLLLEVQSA